MSKKRPEKRTKANGFFLSAMYWEYDKGYNHAHAEWVDFLPTEQELYDLLKQASGNQVEEKILLTQALVISKRLKGD